MKERGTLRAFSLVSTLALGLGLIVVMACAIGLLLPSRPVSSLGPPPLDDIIEVTATDDEYDTTPNATCSLREAVESINTGTSFGGCDNASGTASTIVLLPQVYVLDRVSASPYDNSTGALEPSVGMQIRGAGASQTIIRAALGLGDRVLEVAVPANHFSLIQGVNIQGGQANGSGGGIFAFLYGGANLAIMETVVEDNWSSNSGGGIYLGSSQDVTVTLTAVAVRDNEADQGGGIALRTSSAGSKATLRNVVIAKNAATKGGGGGLLAACSHSLDRVRSTTTGLGHREAGCTLMPSTPPTRYR
jgi:CSLREA domain-containing protein